MTLHFELIETLAFTGLTLFAGYGLRRWIPALAHYNLPAPVVGGLAVAAVVSLIGHWQEEPITFDDTLQKPLMGAFFASIGFRVSVGLLHRGGTAVLLFLLLCSIGAILQNVLGVAIALLIGQPALFGVLCGSTTLAGGPATGLAFAAQFESSGIPHAETVAIAAAILGIILGGLVGTPTATLLIERRNTPTPERPPGAPNQSVQMPAPEAHKSNDDGNNHQTYTTIKSLTLILIVMLTGTEVSTWLSEHVMTLPIYMGAMIVAAAIRNLDDVTGWIGLSHDTLDEIGNVSLEFFLAMSLMTLELWRLTTIAVPMIVILTVQTVFMIVFSVWPIFFRMGNDFEAAVTTGGLLGFMLGTTANALANMDAIVERFGPAPLAYLVVPVVGAFFIDFANAIIIQVCLNLLG